MKKLFLFIVLVTVLLNACKHETLIPGGTPPEGITPPAVGAATICFETNVLPIFVSNCAKVGCHNSITQADGLRFDNYTEIMKSIKPNNASDSKAWEAINETKPDKVMPQPPALPLSKAQKDSVYKWIVQGALNTTNCNTGCDTAFFTYSGAVLPILQSSCIGCHSGASASANLDLSMYNNVRTVALNGKLNSSITHASGAVPMPLGGNKLPSCKITQIQKWITAGAPNN
ncbi:MAG: c-type cytochrome domain-containing protein [Ferruginibacter sp.]